MDGKTEQEYKVSPQRKRFLMQDLGKYIVSDLLFVGKAWWSYL